MSREIAPGDYAEISVRGNGLLYPIVEISTSPLQIFILSDNKGNQAILEPIRSQWQVANFDKPHQVSFYGRDQIFPKIQEPAARSFSESKQLFSRELTEKPTQAFPRSSPRAFPRSSPQTSPQASPEPIGESVEEPVQKSPELIKSISRSLPQSSPRLSPQKAVQKLPQSSPRLLPQSSPQEFTKSSFPKSSIRLPSSSSSSPKQVSFETETSPTISLKEALPKAETSPVAVPKAASPVAISKAASPVAIPKGEASPVTIPKAASPKTETSPVTVPKATSPKTETSPVAISKVVASPVAIPKAEVSPKISPKTVEPKIEVSPKIVVPQKEVSPKSPPLTQGCLFYKRGRADEDRSVTTEINNQGMLFAVFDGHGGSEVSTLLSEKFPNFLAAALKNIDVNQTNIFAQTFQKAIDEFEVNYILPQKVKSGSTATFLFVTDKLVYTINLGDSRTVLFDLNGKIIGATIDHTPNSEKQRIINTGHQVIGGRIDGQIAISRSFGDFNYKTSNGYYSSRSAVSLEASYFVYELANYQFPVYAWLASDGIYQIRDNLRANQIITNEIISAMTLQGPRNICKEVVDNTYTVAARYLIENRYNLQKSIDDITLMVLRLI